MREILETGCGFISYKQIVYILDTTVGNVMKKFKHTNEELKALEGKPTPKRDPDCTCYCHKVPNVKHIVACC